MYALHVCDDYWHSQRRRLPCVFVATWGLQLANLIATQISGNSIPPRDRGCFQGEGARDFVRNAKVLADTIKGKFL